jgi:hypothetical protein
VSDQEEPNWVEKRWRAGNHLADSKLELWRAVCDALTAASKTFNARYQGTSETAQIDGHQFRIVLPAQHRTQIDVKFEEQSGAITGTISYDVPMLHFRNFRISADHLSAFLVDDKDARLTPDEVSKRILESSFFPSR